MNAEDLDRTEALLMEQLRLNRMFDAAEARFRRAGHIVRANAYRTGAELAYRAHRTQDGSIVANKPLPRQVEDDFTALAFALTRNKDAVDAITEDIRDAWSAGRISIEQTYKGESE